MEDTAAPPDEAQKCRIAPWLAGCGVAHKPLPLHGSSQVKMLSVIIGSSYHPDLCSGVVPLVSVVLSAYLMSVMTDSQAGILAEISYSCTKFHTVGHVLHLCIQKKKKTSSGLKFIFTLKLKHFSPLADDSCQTRHARHSAFRTASVSCVQQSHSYIRNLVNALFGHFIHVLCHKTYLSHATVPKHASKMV